MPTKKNLPPAPAYRKAIVTFIDILGFRDIVKRRPAEAIYNAVRELRDSAASSDKEWLKRTGLAETGNWTRSFAFSDSIVRVRPYDAEFSEGGLFHELMALVHAQAGLAISGILIRGGVAVGDIYFDEATLFGPALVAAYDLEATHANYPRIVVDPDAINAFRADSRLRADHHDLADEIHYLKRLLRRGSDGLWFVDYLSAYGTEVDDPELYLGFLANHRQVVVAGLKGAAGIPRLMHKYLWLATYHNDVCGQLNDPEIVAGLRVTKQDFGWIEDFAEISASVMD